MGQPYLLSLLLCHSKVIPARGSATVHASFTPLTLSESERETRCVGLALGFMSLDSEVTHSRTLKVAHVCPEILEYRVACLRSQLAVCVPGKVVRDQGVDVEPVRVDLLAIVKPPL